jgi:hypothetical protein
VNDDTFTTDGSPDEQAFESTVDDAVAFFEAASDADSHTTPPDSEASTDSDRGDS